MSKNPIGLTEAGKGRVLHAFGEEAVILMDGGQTGGVCTQWLERTPPGGGPPPHRHRNEDELFHVLSGRFSFYDGQSGRWTEALPGASAFMPRGSVHTFKNTGTEPGTLLISTMPSGFETFFGRCAEEFARPGPPDMGKIMAIAGEHGIEFVQPG